MNKYHKYLIIFCLVLITTIAFGRIANNDFINYDDPSYLTENHQIKSGINIKTIKWAFSSVVASNWHPLTLLSHALDWSLFGSWAGGHHLVSLLFHIGATLFLFLFLNKTTLQLWPSAIVAALFAVHPLRVESVAWAAERKDVLSMFFGMATLYVYAFYIEDKKISKYLICLFLFILSLMSKPMLVTLPFILLLMDYWPLGRWQKTASQEHNKIRIPYTEQSKKKTKNIMKSRSKYAEKEKLPETAKNSKRLAIELLREKIPFFILIILSSFITLWAQKHAVASLDTLLFSDRMINALISYVTYIGKIFWPFNLAVFYPYQSVVPGWQIFVALCILICVSAISILYIKKAPFLFVGWFWYLGTLVPVIGLVQVGIQTMADRYTYLPSIGIAIMLIWGILYLVPKKKIRKTMLLSASIFFSVALTIMTWQQCRYWKNTSSLFRHALNVTKDNFVAHVNVGADLSAQKKYDEAIYHYREAINIVPDNTTAYNGLIYALIAENKYNEAVTYCLELINLYPRHNEAHSFLVMALVKQGETPEAIKHCRKIIKNIPDYGYIYIELANLIIAQKKTEEAISLYKKAIEINPRLDMAHFHLADALAEQEKNEEAMVHYLEAIKINRSSAGAAHYNLASLFVNQEMMDGAEGHYRETIKIIPDHAEAHYNLAEILVKKGNVNQAMEHFRKSASIKPSFKALNNLGVLLENQQQHDKAIHYYRLALPLEPKNPELHFNLGVALGNKGNLVQAIEHFSRAVELKPNHKEARQALKMAQEMQKHN